MVRFCFLLACFVLGLVAFAANAPEAKAHHHGGAVINVNGVRVRVNGGASVSVNGGPRFNNNVSRFNQNGGVNRIGRRR